MQQRSTYRQQIDPNSEWNKSFGLVIDEVHSLYTQRQCQYTVSYVR